MKLFSKVIFIIKIFIKHKSYQQLLIAFISFCCILTSLLLDSIPQGILNSQVHFR